jgi:hypothetical protein
MPLPSTAALLHQALDLAHAAADPQAREAAVVEVAALAARQGSRDQAAEALVDVQDAAGRLWVHGLLAGHAQRTGEPATAHHHLREALAALEEAPRWRPRPDGWISLDDARARLAGIAAALGAGELLDAIAAPLCPGRPAWAAATRARFSLAAAADGGGRSAAWAEALTAARRLPDPVDARRALVELAAVAVQHGYAARAVRLVRTAADDDPVGGPVHRAELAEAVAGVLAQADHLPEAATVWGRAADLAADPAIPPDIATWLLCSIAEAQLDALGPMIAEHTMARAVAAVAHTPLSPDPTLRFPWRRLARTALSCPALAAPLRDHLRTQPVVPPGWCYALGLMELATGNPARARGAAQALEASHAAWPEDTESLWLGALLRCRVGDRDRAISDIAQLLGLVEAGTPAWIAGDESGPQPLEHHLVRALLDLGDVESAAELARSVTTPALRARLLREAGAVCVLGGDRAAGATLAREALQAREEASTGDGPSSPLDADLPPLIRLLADTGEAPTALSALQRALQRGRPTPDALALPVLSALAGSLGRHPPLAEAVQAAFAQRLEAQEAPADAAALLCAWIRHLP